MTRSIKSRPVIQRARFWAYSLALMSQVALYSQVRSNQTANGDASGRLTVDQRTKIPALQVYADLFLPAGLRLPFGDLMVFSNRIRTTDTFALEMRRSSLDELNTTRHLPLYVFERLRITSNARLTVGWSYFYTVNKVSADLNSYGYEFNTLLTIQFSEQLAAAGERCKNLANIFRSNSSNPIWRKYDRKTP